MKNLLPTGLALILLYFSTSAANAQDEGFMYGKVTTFDKQTYEGPIRWGKEEVYWIDVFNASKEENENLKYLAKEEKESLCCRGMRGDGKEWKHFQMNGHLVGWHKGNGVNWVSTNSGFTHQFSCQFGEIRSIAPKRGNRAQLELQSGLKMEVSGEGYNDIGTDVKVLDKEIGEIELNWNRIEKIEFKATPSKLVQKFGESLFGTVETYQGSFKGAIQWDHEERLSTDKLDGDTEDGKVSVAFDKIKSIERFQNRSRIMLQSGRDLEMSGSNDVNSQNRGIIVTQDNGLMVDIPWSEFKKANYGEGKMSSLKKYDEFKSQKAISATVSTSKGKSLSGKTVIDLDEEYDFELFQGREGDIEYTTPMRNISKIVLKEKNSADITLKNNDKLTLKGTQDVGEMNQGVLVFGTKDKPDYIPWDEVSEIKLD